MPLQDRIIAYVTASNGLVSLEKILTVAAAKDFSEDEVLQALDGIGKKLKATVRGGTVYYQTPPAPKPTATSHLEWLRNNYPRPPHCEHGIESYSCDYCKPFPDISYSFIFLKTKEERDDFKALASGRPIYLMNKKRYS